LDWETFDTAAEAQDRAVFIALVGETFIIEEFDEECPRCAESTKKYAVH